LHASRFKGLTGMHTNSAWQVKYKEKPDKPKSFTVTWHEGVEEQSYNDALLACLRGDWCVHE